MRKMRSFNKIKKSNLTSTFHCRKLSNNDPVILIEKHETPFLGSILRRIKEIKHIKVQNYNVDLAQSNKYLEVIIQSLEPKIFD